MNLVYIFIVILIINAVCVAGLNINYDKLYETSAYPDQYKFDLHMINTTHLIVNTTRTDRSIGWGRDLHIEVYNDHYNDLLHIGPSKTNNRIMVYNLSPYNISVPVVNLNYTQNIPKKIHQTWIGLKYMTKEMKMTMHLIQELNPEYEFLFYSNIEAEAYVKKYGDNRTKQAYDMLIPGAYKADLFRLIVMYTSGGIYVDCKSIPLHPFRDLVYSEDQLILVRDWDDGRHLNIYNALIASIPRHPLIKHFINSVVDNILSRRYGNDPLDITGPTALGTQVRMIMNISKDISLSLTSFTYNQYRVNIKWYHECVLHSICNTYDRSGHMIVLKQYSSYTKASGTGYDELWHDRHVFN
jgi:mannosyltransferase OCH1-like enzyme